MYENELGITTSLHSSSQPNASTTAANASKSF